MVDVLRKELSMGFDEAVERVERIVKEEGFSVLLTKSIDEIMKKKLGLARAASTGQITFPASFPAGARRARC